jgi:hypothetical protein
MNKNTEDIENLKYKINTLERRIKLLEFQLKTPSKYKIGDKYQDAIIIDIIPFIKYETGICNYEYELFDGKNKIKLIL